jgi:hypothetical protein
MAANLISISPEQANEIIAMNRQGEKPAALKPDKNTEKQNQNVVEFKDLAEQDSLTRFDKKKKQKPAKTPNHQPTNQHGNNPNKNAGKPHNRRNKPNKPKPNNDKTE